MFGRPVVFLSSVFFEGDGAARTRLGLRDLIVESLRSDAVADLRAHEFSLGDVASRGEESADDIIDRCFADIKACDLFVFLRTRRHGSGVLWRPDDATVATYLEMELFAAALLQKPILILCDREYEPEPRLADLLRVLQRLLPSSNYLMDSEASLVSALQTRVRELARTAETPLHQPKSVADALSRLRSPGSGARDLTDPSLFFLGGLPARGERGGEIERARRLLGEVAGGDIGGPAGMSHGAALFRLWAATRELTSYDHRDPQVAELWDDALGIWSSRASWFGVHGHIYLGPLAALNSQIALRRQQTSCSISAHSREPFGARASALYSVAQKMQQWDRKVRHYKQAALEATKAIDLDLTGSGGALSVRGHAQLRLALLGRPWLLTAAQNDFQASLDTRRRSQASAGSIGEAQTDLGFSMVMMGRVVRGFDLVAEGVELLREDSSVSGRSFLARGLRKLEESGRLTGRLRAARRAREERIALAASIDAVDQMRS